MEHISVLTLKQKQNCKADINHSALVHVHHQDLQIVHILCLLGDIGSVIIS